MSTLERLNVTIAAADGQRRQVIQEAREDALPTSLRKWAALSRRFQDALQHVTQDPTRAYAIAKEALDYPHPDSL